MTLRIGLCVHQLRSSKLQHWIQSTFTPMGFFPYRQDVNSQTDNQIWNMSRTDQRRLQSGAPALLRQRGGILDIATAMFSRSNCATGFVNQHRVLSLMEGLCRTANLGKAGMVVGALRIACNGLCTAARFHTVEENRGCLLVCHEGPDCIRHYNRFPTLFESLCSLWPGTGECISPTAIFNEPLFKIAVRSDRLCILAAGLLDAFVTAKILQRNNRGSGLNFKELVYGRVKMMTASCPAWAHTYQTMCLGFHPEQLRPEAFRLPKPIFVLPCYLLARLLPDRLALSLPAGDSSQMGTEMADWELRLSRLNSLLGSFVAQSCVIPGYRRS